MSDTNDFWGSSKKPDEKPLAKGSGLRSDAPQSTANFYAKGAAQPAPAEDPGVWGAATKAKAAERAERDALLADPDLNRKRRRRLVRRVLLGTTGGLLLILLIAVALAPQIASALAPGLVADAAGGAIAGKASLAKANLSWGGPQRLEGLRLASPDGKSDVLRATAEVDRSLWSLATGGLDLGTVTITKGKADIVRYEDGTTNLDKALASPGAPSTKPAVGSTTKPPTKKPAAEPRLPADLRVKLLVKDFDATLTDRAAEGGKPLTVTLEDANLAASIAPARPLTADLSAKAVPAGGAGPGTITLKAKIDTWTRTDGTLTLDQAKGEVALTLESLPTELIDALLPARRAADGRLLTLRESLGPSLRATVTLKGDRDKADGAIDAAFTNASLTGGIAYAQGIISAPAPLTLRAAGRAVRMLAPEIDASLGRQDRASLDSLPDVTLTVESLRLPFRPGQKAADLRGGAASLRLATSEVTGRVRLAAGRPDEPFRIAPLAASLTSDDLAKGLRLVANSSATVGGRPAGELAVDLSATGLLDAAGSPVRGMPGALSGRASIKGIATAIAQPFLPAADLDLPRDVGETLDVDLVAGADEKSGSQSLQFTAQASRLRAAASLERTPQRLRLTGDGLRLEADSAGALASRLLPPSSGWRLAADGAGGKAVVLVPALDIPADLKTGALKLDQAQANASVELGGVALGPAAANPADDIRVGTIKLTTTLRPGGEAAIGLVSAFSQAGGDFNAAAAFDVKGLLVATPATSGAPAGVALAPPLSLRPKGKLWLNSIPPALVGVLVPPAPPAPAGAAAPEAPLDLGALAGDLSGGPINIVVESAPVAGNAGAIDLTISAKAPRLEASAGGELDVSKASLRATSIVTTLAPQTLGAILRAYAPSVAASLGQAALDGPARVQLDVKPITIPLGPDARPQLDKVGLAKASLGIAGQTFVTGLQARNQDGSTRDLGRVGVEDFRLAADLPISAFLGPSRPEDKTLRATLAGALLGQGSTPVLRLEGDLAAEIQRGTLAGQMTASAKLVNINTGALESLAGKPGLLTGVLGDRATIDLAVQASPPPAGGTIAQAPLEATLAVSAPRVTSDGPVRISLTPERVTLRQSARLSIDPDREALNTFLAKAVVTKEGGQALGLRAIERVSLSLEKLSLPRTAAAGAPPELLINLTLPRVGLAAADGSPISLAQTALKIETETPKPGAVPGVRFRLDVGEASVADQPPAKGMNLAGHLADLFTPAGGIDPARALLSASGDMPAVPTALVDALANQQGLLVEALGPVVSMKLLVERYPVSPAYAGTISPPPVIDFRLTSPRASVALRGTSQPGLFVAEKPLEVSVTELTQTLAKRFLGVTPLIGSVEKTPADAPATISAANLTLGLDGDLRKLNADIRVSPGEARFATSSGFASILKTLNQKVEGTVGRRLDPLDVQVRSGVATYQKWRVPLGEFSVETEGTVDLVQKQVDVVTWVPFGALTDQAAGSFNTGLGSLLGRNVPVIDALTMVPFRTRGSMDNPSTRPDAELAAKNLVKSLKPDELIKKGLGDLLKPKTPK